MTLNISRLFIVVTFILSFILRSGTVILAQNYQTQNINSSDNAVAKRVISGSQVRQAQTPVQTQPQTQTQTPVQTNTATQKRLQPAFFSKSNKKNTSNNNTNNDQMPDFPKTPGMKYVKVVDENGGTVYVPEQFVQDYQQQHAQANNNQKSTHVADKNVTATPSVPVSQPAHQESNKSSFFNFHSPFSKKSAPAQAVGNQAPTTVNTNTVTVTPSVSEQKTVAKKKFSLKSFITPFPVNNPQKDNTATTVTTTPSGTPTPAEPLPSNNVPADEKTPSNSTDTIDNPFAQPQPANSVYTKFDNTSKNTGTMPSVPEVDIPDPEMPDMLLSEKSEPSTSTLEPVPESVPQSVSEPEKLLPEEFPLPDQPEPKPSLSELEPTSTQDVPIEPVTQQQPPSNPIRQKSINTTPSTEPSKTSGQLIYPLEPVELTPATPDVDSQLPDVQLPDAQPVEPQPQDVTTSPLPDIESESIEPSTTQIPVVALPEPESTVVESATSDSSNPLELEILGPKEVEYGKNEKFTLIISNNSSFPMTNLTLRVHPEGFGEDKTATVKIQELVPDQPRRISMKLNARQKNALSLMANIANESGIITQKEIAITVKEEKIKVSILPPTHIPNIGEKATYTVQITNQTEQAAMFNIVVFFSEGLEPAEIQGIENKLQTGQIETTTPIELKANDVRNITVTAIAHKEGTHTTLVQLVDLQGNTYTSKNNCTYGHRAFPVPLETKADEVKTLDSTMPSTEEVLIQDDQAAPMPQDLGIDELPGVATDIAVPEELPAQELVQQELEPQPPVESKQEQDVESIEPDFPPIPPEINLPPEEAQPQKSEENTQNNNQNLIMSDFMK